MMDKVCCSGCKAEADWDGGNSITWARLDVYGIFTGIYCDDCYNSDDSDRYPYRKDSYAQDLEHGEHIWPEEERY